MMELLSFKKRFKDFSNKPLKTKKLKDICTINKGKQLNKNNMIEDGEYYVLNGGKESSGFTDIWNVEENTITISEGGNSCGFISFNKEKFFCGGHCYYLSELNKEIKNEYLYYFLKNNEKNIMKLRVGSGLPNIQKKDINNLNIVFPSFKEQIQISNYLIAIDKKINNVQKSIESFKIFKKELLIELFI